MGSGCWDSSPFPAADHKLTSGPPYVMPSPPARRRAGCPPSTAHLRTLRITACQPWESTGLGVRRTQLYSPCDPSGWGGWGVKAYGGGRCPVAPSLLLAPTLADVWEKHACVLPSHLCLKIRLQQTGVFGKCTTHLPTGCVDSGWGSAFIPPGEGSTVPIPWEAAQEH